MKVIQKVVFVGSLIIAGLYFFYTLSFSTGWALGQPLGDFFLNAQIVNKLIFKWSLWTLVFAVLLILFQTHKNRNYYITNFVLITLFVGSMIGSANIMITELPRLKLQYLELNEAFLTLIQAINDSTMGTKIFDYGMILSYVMIGWSVVVVLFTIWKTIFQVKRIKEKKIRLLEVHHGN